MDDGDIELIMFIGEVQNDPDRMREAFSRSRERLREQMPELYREFQGRLREVMVIVMDELKAPDGVRKALDQHMRRWGLDA